MRGTKAKKLRRLAERVAPALPEVSYFEKTGRRLDGRFFSQRHLGHCKRKLYKGLKQLARTTMA